MGASRGGFFGCAHDQLPWVGVGRGTAASALHAACGCLIQDWYPRAAAALRVLGPRETPILWPEHFDVAILLDNTSYGASPGDASHPTPYAYVSSDDHDGSDFWNAPFGAIRGREQVGRVEDLVTFWRAGQALLKAHTN